MTPELKTILKDAFVAILQHEQALREDLHSHMALMQVLETLHPGIGESVSKRSEYALSQSGDSPSSRLIRAAIQALDQLPDQKS